MLSSIKTLNAFSSGGARGCKMGRAAKLLVEFVIVQRILNGTVEDEQRWRHDAITVGKEQAECTERHIIMSRLGHT